MTNPCIRLEFKKFGGLKYISHLDLQRAILRFIKRAKLPIRYTEGFNPHPKLVFALTMSVGMESECELVDIFLERNSDNPEEPIITCDDFVMRLGEVLPNGLEIVKAYYPDKSFKDIVSAEYDITLYKTTDTKLASLVKNSLLHPVEIVKKTKGGEKTVDITPLVKGVSFNVEEGETECRIHAELSAKQNEYLNPDHFVKGLMDGECRGLIDSWQVVRTKINFKES